MSLKKIKESVKDESRGDRHRLIYSTESTVVELGFARYSNRGDTDEAYLLHRVLIARKHDGGENWSRPFSRSFRESMKGQKMLGISPREGEKGMWVIYVFENSPADKAGMRPGDLITKLNGESLAGLTAGEFVKRVKKLDAVELEITSKAGTTRTVRLEPADASTFSNVLVGPNLDLLHLDTGDEAPDFEATAPDGKTIRLSELKGAPVLINFTATWCMPCKEEMPFLKAAYSKYKVQGFRIISVYLDDADKDVFAYAKELGADWPIHSDGKGWKNAVAEKYGVIGVPKNVLVGKDGKILHTNVRDARIEAAIEEALR
jgi:peroxiredoxin